jgi:hypothetical protein
MTDIADALKTRMTNYSALNTVVNGRAYYGKLPQEVSNPCINYFQVSSVPVSSMGSDHSLTRARFQFNVWAATYTGTNGVRSVVKLLKAALARYRQASNPVIQDIMILEGGRDLYEPDFKLVGSTLDFEVTYEEE